MKHISELLEENMENLLQKSQELEEFRLEVQRLYDEWLYKTEKRGASYGELAYIQDLSEEELQNMYEELIEEGVE